MHHESRCARKALLRHGLRPPVAQGRVEQHGGGLVLITLEKAYARGTMAADRDRLRGHAGWAPTWLHDACRHPLSGRAGQRDKERATAAPRETGRAHHGT